MAHLAQAEPHLCNVVAPSLECLNPTASSKSQCAEAVCVYMRERSVAQALPGMLKKLSSWLHSCRGKLIGTMVGRCKGPCGAALTVSRGCQILCTSMKAMSALRPSSPRNREGARRGCSTTKCRLKSFILYNPALCASCIVAGEYAETENFVNIPSNM
jgi:hypothetical protein